MKRLAWNVRLFYWLIEKVSRHPEGDVFPLYVMVMRWMIMPFDSFRWYLNLNDHLFRYDPQQDVFTIYGMKYSGSLFRSFSHGGVRIGAWIRIVSRNDGKLILGTVSPEIQKKFDVILEEERRTR